MDWKGVAYQWPRKYMYKRDEFGGSQSSSRDYNTICIKHRLGFKI